MFEGVGERKFRTFSCAREPFDPFRERNVDGMRKSTTLSPKSTVKPVDVIRDVVSSVSTAVGKGRVTVRVERFDEVSYPVVELPGKYA